MASTIFLACAANFTCTASYRIDRKTALLAPHPMQTTNSSTVSTYDSDLGQRRIPSGLFLLLPWAIVQGAIEFLSPFNVLVRRLQGRYEARFRVRPDFVSQKGLRGCVQRHCTHTSTRDLMGFPGCWYVRESRFIRFERGGGRRRKI